MLSSRALCRCVIYINKNYSSFNRQLKSSSLVLNDNKSKLIPEPFQTEPLKYETVGLTQFVGSPPEVKGILRTEVTDFQVHEIDLNGNIIYLTDLGPPPHEHGPDLSTLCYTHCTLYRQGVAVNTVINTLAAAFRTSKNYIRFAGIKDKEGQITQRISVEKIDARRLIHLSDNTTSIKLGNYAYSANPISVGDLKGNHFTIFVRNLKLVDSSSQLSTGEAFKMAIQNFKKLGFVNYFGLQRFGTPGLGAPTHLVGQAIFQQNWEEVFDLILQPKNSDNKQMSHMKAMWFSDRDPVKIIEKYPNLRNNKSDEACLLVGLSKFYNNGKGNLSKAFLSTPERSREFLAVSFQSFIWNHIASFRLEKFGLEVIPGDVVKIQSNSQSEFPKDFDEVNNPDDALVTLKNVKVLTEKDLENNHQYSIYDVLLPAPGQLVPPFQNPVIQNYFEQFLMDHQVNMKYFTEGTDSRAKLPYVFYRHLVVKPENVTHKFILYDSDPAFKLDVSRLMPSDMDRLKYRDFDTKYLTKSSTPEKNNVGAILEFSLPPSSYATMALREIVKLKNEIY